MNWLRLCCVQCRNPLFLPRQGLCSRCDKLIVRTPYCSMCGSLLTQNAKRCGICLQRTPDWDQMVIVGRYQEPLSSLIHRFKFQNQFWLDRTLARLLLLAVYQARREQGLLLPELLIPVPLHRLRQWRRGYNQAALIAAYLSRWLSLPCRNDLLYRIKHTTSQLGLSAAMRRKNLQNAFSASPQLCHCGYTSVALIDDVITTGTTLNTLAKLLRAQGISHIQVWGLARA